MIGFFGAKEVILKPVKLGCLLGVFIFIKKRFIKLQILWQQIHYNLTPIRI